MRVYRRHRIGHLWFVNPTIRTLEVFRLHDEGWLLLGTWAGAATVRAEPLEALELDLLWLWGGRRTEEDQAAEEYLPVGGYLVDKQRAGEG